MAYKPLEIEFQFRSKRWSDAQKGLEALGRQFEGGLQKASPELAKQMNSFLHSVADALTKRHSGAWSGGTGAKTLSKRSGKGIQSIRDSIAVVGSNLNDLEGRIGANFYMAVQERGATIRARKAKYLTIPLPAALDARGLPLRRSARDWDNTFIGQSKAGNLLIFQKRGSAIVPLYVLKKQVTIPARLGMQATLKAGLPYFVDKAFDSMLREMLK